MIKKFGGLQIFYHFAILRLKKKFCRYKSPVPLRDVDIEKILVSCEISSGEKSHKYFIGYFYHDHKFKDVILPKTSTYVNNHYEQRKWMYFSIEDDDLLEN